MRPQGFPKVGQYIDFKDNDQTWKVGIVLDINEHKARIRIEGSSQEHDIMLSIGEMSSGFKHPRVQPFRSVVRGRTGQKRTLAARPQWKFSKQDHQSRMKRLEEFIRKPRGKSPEQVVQYIKGEHYFYLQFLFSNKYAKMEELTKVY